MQALTKDTDKLGGVQFVPFSSQFPFLSKHKYVHLQTVAPGN